MWHQVNQNFLFCDLSSLWCLVGKYLSILDGFSYEKSAIIEWFDRGNNSSPMTNVELVSRDLSENDILKEKIEEYLKSMDFGSFGPDLLNL